MFQVEFWKLFFKCGNSIVPKKKKHKLFDTWRHKEAWLLNYALNYGKKTYKK